MEEQQMDSWTWSELQTTPIRIWNLIADSISYGGNYYVKGVSFNWNNTVKILVWKYF